MNALLRFIREEEGISSLEYALIAVLIALAIVVGAGALGDGINKVFADIGARLTGVVVPPIP
jgi:pilus assembly protein Flp/PilA